MADTNNNNDDDNDVLVQQAERVIRAEREVCFVFICNALSYCPHLKTIP
jgi:thioredoxin-related protein